MAQPASHRGTGFACYFILTFKVLQPGGEGGRMAIPKDPVFDSALSLLCQGNAFIYNRCRKFGADIFQTRLMLKETVCIQGEEAARQFYQPGRMTRQGAIPKTVLWSLQDEGSVATLNDAAHLQRKKMFMSMMNHDTITQLLQLANQQWRQEINHWQTVDQVSLLPAVEKILCATVCKWAGIRLTAAQNRQRSIEIAAMIDGAGSIGWRNWRGLWLRRRTERWLQQLIKYTRSGDYAAPIDSPLHIIAFHQQDDGNIMTAEVAAAELLNILRPTVAVARYILFCAIAIHKYPVCREKLASGDTAYLEAFVQEVRRFYPFFPFVGGIVRQPFFWHGHQFDKGIRVMLDIYGTNRDPRLWQQPETFQPERFIGWQQSPYALIPQGGGDVFANHRCAGEWITVELMRQAVRIFSQQLSYNVVPADLSIQLQRMPALPAQPFIISQVKVKEVI
jgi:fatty-acid peroxygenase